MASAMVAGISGTSVQQPAAARHFGTPPLGAELHFGVCSWNCLRRIWKRGNGPIGVVAGMAGSSPASKAERLLQEASTALLLLPPPTGVYRCTESRPLVSTATRRARPACPAPVRRRPASWLWGATASHAHAGVGLAWMSGKETELASLAIPALERLVPPRPEESPGAPPSMLPRPSSSCFAKLLNSDWTLLSCCLLWFILLL
mmetsp:Transcript_61644/g.180150  ORF Transcript_61644/g.180150 Transcript_61644/m.180150 type:complete len:203 (-) Transcript_61644:1520-2128(-)